MKGLITITVDTQTSHETSQDDHKRAMGNLRRACENATRGLNNGTVVKIDACNPEYSDSFTLLLGRLTKWSLRMPGAEPEHRKKGFWAKLGDDLRKAYNEGEI